MKKIPLEATIVGAYKFFFQNIISIIGTVWLPAVIFLVVIGAFVVGIVPHAWLTGHFEPPQNVDGFVRDRIGLILLAAPCAMITAFVVGAMIKVGILRLALGQTSGLTLVWFSLGGRVWRMIAAAFVAIFVGVVMEIAAVIVFMVVNGVLAVIPNTPVVLIGLVNAVLVIAIIVAVIYVVVRLFFFLPAVIVAENRIGLARSWALGKANVLRAIAVWLAVTIPIHVVATIIVYATVIPTVVVQAIHMQPGNEAAAMAFVQSLWPLLPVILVIVLLAGLVMASTILGAIGKAYTAVTDETV